MTDNGFIDELSDYITEYFYNTKQLPKDFAVTSLIPGGLEIYRRITTIPELQNYAITHNSNIFQITPLLTHLDNRGNIVINNCYYGKNSGEIAIVLNGMYDEEVIVDVCNLYLREFFGYTVRDEAAFDFCIDDIDNVTELLNFVEVVKNYEPEKFFQFPY